MYLTDYRSVPVDSHLVGDRRVAFGAHEEISAAAVEEDTTLSSVSCTQPTNKMYENTDRSSVRREGKREKEYRWALSD